MECSFTQQWRALYLLVPFVLWDMPTSQGVGFLCRYILNRGIKQKPLNAYYQHITANALIFLSTKQPTRAVFIGFYIIPPGKIADVSQGHRYTFAAPFLIPTNGTRLILHNTYICPPLYPNRINGGAWGQNLDKTK